MKIVWDYRLNMFVSFKLSGSNRQKLSPTVSCITQHLTCLDFLTRYISFNYTPLRYTSFKAYGK